MGELIRVYGTEFHVPSGAAPRLEPEVRGTVLVLPADPSGTALYRLEVPLGDAAGYWHHPSADRNRPLAPDWACAWRTVGLADSAPLGCLYDAAGRALLAFATDRTVAATRIRFGVSEDSARFNVWLEMDLRPGEECRLRIEAPGRPMAETVSALTQWASGGKALPTPESARVPAYSTWYAMHRAVDAESVEAEAALAVAKGCGVLLLDDGWQLHAHGKGYAGCGDWAPDPEKFADFATHVKTVRAMGMRYVAWIAPLLLGERSSAYAELAEYAPHVDAGLDCRILDPRCEQVRTFVVESCVGLVERYGLDGLKVDFLDPAMVYGTDGDGGGVDGGGDVGLAMRELLTQLRDRLCALRGDELLLEIRQPYISPAMFEFGNLARASDCPADAAANRVKTLDIRAVAPSGAVHSDMLMWDPAAPAEAAARQLHGALFAVPQISVRLAGQSAEHRAVTDFWLRFWLEHRDVLTRGSLSPGRPDELYTAVLAEDADRAVLAYYAEGRVIALRPDRYREIALVNSTSASRVLLDLDGPAAEYRLDLFDACGRPAGSDRRLLRSGPHRLAVPPCGLCLLRPA